MKKAKLVQGWGVNDVSYLVCKYIKVNGKRIRVWACPYYLDWLSILQRTFSKKLHEKHPTYKDCTICEEWKYLSNFIKWVDSQPNKDWRDCQLDKDFLIDGNKHYSPETAVYIPRNLNTFILDPTKSRGAFMIGVRAQKGSKVNPYRVQCCNPFTLQQEYLGSFPTELEAHLAWKAKKHEHALKLADLQSDVRVAKALRQWYSPDKDWTKR